MAQMAYNQVLKYAGCSLHRDNVDDIIVMDTQMGVASHTGTKLDKNGKADIPGIIDSQDDNRPQGKAGENWDAWPELKSEPAPLDTDGDGIPDAWEKEVGMNPNDASDGNTVDPQSGYTYLEIYLSTLVQHIVKGGNVGGRQMRR